MSTYIGVLPLEILHSLSQAKERRGLAKLEFLRLPHPRTGVPSLFIPYEATFDTAPSRTLPQSRIFEVQAVSPPENRSWLTGNQVIADGKLLVITPIDPVFLLIPILQAARQDDRTQDNFLPSDDIFEAASSQLQKSSHSHQDQSLHILGEDILRFSSLTCVKEALKSVCDVKDITEDIIVYRFSLSKTMEYLRNKVARLLNPLTLEISRTVVRGFAKDGLMEDGKDELLKIGQTKATCDLLSQYISTDIRATLVASYDFRALDAYLQTIEAEPFSSAVNAKSRAQEHDKSTRLNGEEKKRKPTKASHGVEKLKKVNVNGMAKLSSFFKKS